MRLFLVSPPATTVLAARKLCGDKCEARDSNMAEVSLARGGLRCDFDWEQGYNSVDADCAWAPAPSECFRARRAAQPQELRKSRTSRRARFGYQGWVVLEHCWVWCWACRSRVVPCRRFGACSEVLELLLSIQNSRADCRRRSKFVDDSPGGKP